MSQNVKWKSGENFEFHGYQLATLVTIAMQLPVLLVNKITNNYTLIG